MQENPSAQENLDTSTPDTEAANAAAAQEADTLTSLEDQIRALEQKAAEHHDAWLRAKAEGENIRRRAAEDVIKAQKFAIEKFANALLPVKDSLEQALALDNATLETLREGTDLTLKNVIKAFEQSGVEEINPVGEKFDPHKHQAISALPSDQPANTVVQVFQKGYQLEGRVLRPALVAVAQAA
ncbi:MAG: nucleotide exchange factor GrpE [Moraxellaceae bacterium]|nr:nucleotide exchange factor GrpE [Moraxellaceae bacterium]